MKHSVWLTNDERQAISDGLRVAAIQYEKDALIFRADNDPSYNARYKQAYDDLVTHASKVRELANKIEP